MGGLPGILDAAGRSPPVADHTLARLPRAAWSRFSACGVGTGVEPATARFMVWCSTTELTSVDTTIGQNPCTEHTSPTASLEDRATCAAGPAVSLLPKRRRWESNPLEAALQAAAVPSGSSATLSVSSPGIEPGLRPSQGRVRIRHTPRTYSRSAPRRGIEPRLAVSKTAVLIRHTRRACQVSRPGIEPGSGPSEGPMRSVTPSRHSASRPGVEPGPGP